MYFKMNEFVSQKLSVTGSPALAQLSEVCVLFLLILLLNRKERCLKILMAINTC